MKHFVIKYQLYLLMDPLINSKMILLNELSILEEYGFTPPKVLTDEDDLNDIQFHYNLLKNKYFLKYGNYNFNDNKKIRLEQSIDKFLYSLFELNNVINEKYSFDPYNMMINHMDNFNKKYNYNLNRKDLELMLGLFVRNKLSNIT